MNCISVKCPEPPSVTHTETTQFIQCVCSCVTANSNNNKGLIWGQRLPSGECRVHSLIWSWRLLLWQLQPASEHRPTGQLQPGERQRDRQRDRQTERQTDRETERQRETYRQRQTQTRERETEKGGWHHHLHQSCHTTLIQSIFQYRGDEHSSMLQCVCVCVCTYVVTMPTCLSMLKMRLLAPCSYSLDKTSFSTPNTTPSLQRIPMAVLRTDRQTDTHRQNLRRVEPIVSYISVWRRWMFRLEKSIFLWVHTALQPRGLFGALVGSLPNWDKLACCQRP